MLQSKVPKGHFQIMPPRMVDRQDRERPLRLVQDGDEFVRIDSHRGSFCVDSSAREPLGRRRRGSPTRLLGPPVFVPSGLDDPEQKMAFTFIRGKLQVVLEAAYFGEDRQSTLPADTAGRTGHRAAAIDDGSRHPSTRWPPAVLATIAR